MTPCKRRRPRSTCPAARRKAEETWEERLAAIPEIVKDAADETARKTEAAADAPAEAVRKLPVKFHKNKNEA